MNNKALPLISVIIPVFNANKYIKKCLNSIINQTYKNVEIICVEDFSTDNSKDIINEYIKLGYNIKLLWNNTNLGAGLTRNRGILKATGDYILFLDSDDWLQKNAIATLVKRLKKFDKNIDVIYYRAKKINNKTRYTIISKKFKKSFINKLYNIYDNPEILEYWTSGMYYLLRRDFVIKNNILFDDYRCIEDILYSVLVAKYAKTICFINDIILNYRTNRQNSVNSNIYNSVDIIINTVKSTLDIAEKLPVNTKIALKKYIYRYLFMVLQGAYLKQNLDYENFKQIIKTYVNYEILKLPSYPYTIHLQYMYEKLYLLSSNRFRQYMYIKAKFPTFIHIYLFIRKLFFKF